MSKNNNLFGVRLDPREKLVVKTLADTFTMGNQSELMKTVICELGEHFGILAAGDLAELQNPGQQPRKGWGYKPSPDENNREIGH